MSSIQWSIFYFLVLGLRINLFNNKEKNQLFMERQWSCSKFAQICSQFFFCCLLCIENALLLGQVSVQFTTMLLYQICCHLFFCCLLCIRNVLLSEQNVQFTTTLLYRFQIPAELGKGKIKLCKAKLFFIGSVYVPLIS